MNLQMEIEPAMAIKIAQYFELNGLTTNADQMWLAINHVAAYDRSLREEFGDIIFNSREPLYERGSVVRSRFILYLAAISFPTKTLTAAYFENLRLVLANRPKLNQPGKVVLGLGTGRCGSTTLSAAFGGLPDACATHENPPHIFWQPQEEQVRFHLDRLRMLVDYFPIVFDAAHWWFNTCPRFWAEFPTGKVIGLVRETDSTVRSFLKFQGRGFGSLNNWAPAENGIWKTSLWDPTYPSYPLPPGIVPNTDEAYATKSAMITRYVNDYNQALGAMAVANPERVLLLRTEALNDPMTTGRLRSFVGMNVSMPAVALNVGNDSEGAQQHFWF